MAKLQERLFWMDLNDEGLDEIGYLMTMEQLLKELPEVYEQGKKRPVTEEDIEAWLNEPEDIYVNNKNCKGFSGEYFANKTFTVKEIESPEELKDLMTWKDFDYENGYTAVCMDKEYPDFVPEELQLSMCVYGDAPGWTSSHLPGSYDDNPTVEKYAKELELGDISGLRYDYSDLEKAKIDISVALHCGDLTKDEFDEILDSYGINLDKEVEHDR